MERGEGESIRGTERGGSEMRGERGDKNLGTINPYSSCYSCMQVQVTDGRTGRSSPWNGMGKVAAAAAPAAGDVSGRSGGESEREVRLLNSVSSHLKDANATRRQTLSRSKKRRSRRWRRRRYRRHDDEEIKGFPYRIFITVLQMTSRKLASNWGVRRGCTRGGQT